jgi:16S rRNA (adenine1518-N6/adenine1519-N6)-dimethyltransferase
MRSAMNGHRARRRFGQHFLRDRHVVERIIRAFDPQPTDTVVEIGPGQGVLTHELVGRVGRLHAVELDRDLVAHLRHAFSPDALTLHSTDALRFEFRALAGPGTKLRLIGNLPYNISTPLLFHLLEQIDVVHDMLFMLQKEVVDRLAAAPGGKDYGRLSVMIQWRLRVERLFDVGPGAFSPPPRVDSAVVRLTPHATPPIEVSDSELFSRVVQAAFAQRRKTLRNNLKGLVDTAALPGLGIEPNRRAETLTLEEFARLARCAPVTGES